MDTTPENLLHPLRDRLAALYPNAMFRFDLCDVPHIGGFLDTDIEGHEIVIDWMPTKGFSGAHDDTLCWDHAEIWQQDMEGILRYVEEVVAGTWVFPGYGPPKVWGPR